MIRRAFLVLLGAFAAFLAGFRRRPRSFVRIDQVWFDGQPQLTPGHARFPPGSLPRRSFEVGGGQGWNFPHVAKQGAYDATLYVVMRVGAASRYFFCWHCDAPRTVDAIRQTLAVLDLRPTPPSKVNPLSTQARPEEET